MPCCQRPDHILDICYHQRLEAESPPLLCRIPAGAARPLHNCIFTVPAVFTQRSARQCGSAEDVAGFWAFTLEGMWNMSSMWRWIALEVLLSFWSLRGLRHWGMRWRNTLVGGVCSAQQTLLAYMNRPVVKIWHWIARAKISCGSFNHTLKKNTAGEKKTLLKYWQHNSKIEGWSVFRIENCVFKSLFSAG